MDPMTSPIPQKRLVTAPLTETFGPENSVLNVLLEEDEEVQWHWAHSEGRSIVTGYEIIKRPSATLPLV